MIDNVLSLQKEGPQERLIGSRASPLHGRCSAFAFAGLGFGRPVLYGRKKTNCTHFSANFSGQIHKHCNSWISGVYYPHATDGICFHRPLTSNWSLETDEWNAFNSDIWKIEPVDNTLLIFPSLLQHSILKNKSDKTRYSIAFNVLPTGRFGQGDSTIYISAK